MNLKLNNHYDDHYLKGYSLEVLDMEQNPKYMYGVGVKVMLYGKEVWLTIAWFTIDPLYK